MKLCYTLFLLAAWLPARASLTNLSAANVTRTGLELNTITVGAATYARVDLTQLTLQSYAGGNSGVFLVQDTGLGAVNDPLTLSAAARRALLESDWHLGTGIINPSSTVFASALFNAAVVNGPGPDIFFFEIDGAATPNPVDFRINGITLSVTGAEYNAGLGVSTANSDVVKTRNTGDSADITPGNFTETLNNPVRINSIGIVQTVFGLGLDLDDFGVAPGGTVAGVEWKSGSTAFVDPVLIVGVAVPEPTSVSLLAGGLGLGWLRMQRKR